MRNVLKPNWRALMCITLSLYVALISFVYALQTKVVTADEPPERPATPVRPIVPPRATSSLATENPSGAIVHNAHYLSGYIELTLDDVSSNYFTVVEWMDTTGIGHAVDGWRSDIVDGRIRWWVAKRDFGKGPFRWQVYDRQTGIPIAETYAFYLPQSNTDVTLVDLQLNVPECEQTIGAVISPTVSTTRKNTQSPRKKTAALVQQKVVFRNTHYCKENLPINP